MQRAFASVLILLAFASCGGGDNKSAILNEGPATEVTGVWGRHCLADGATYDDTELIFGNPTMDMSMRFYTDAACTQLQYTAHYVGSYTLGDPYGEGKAIDIKPAAMDITPMVESYVQYLNFLKLCGYADWKLFESHSCASLVQPLYTIFLIEENTSYTGLSTIQKNGSAPERRHNLLDRASPYYRQ